MRYQGFIVLTTLHKQVNKRSRGDNITVENKYDLGTPDRVSFTTYLYLIYLVPVLNSLTIFHPLKISLLEFHTNRLIVKVIPDP